MNTNRIFLGNVMCSDKEFVKTTVLLKCKGNLYIALDNIDTVMNIYKINHNRSILFTCPTEKNDYLVSIYYSQNKSV